MEVPVLDIDQAPLPAQHKRAIEWGIVVGRYGIAPASEGTGCVFRDRSVTVDTELRRRLELSQLNSRVIWLGGGPVAVEHLCTVYHNPGRIVRTSNQRLG